MDFNDVFGGPPRRFSMHENRTRFSSEEQERPSSFKPVFGEKPVFGGDDGVTKRISSSSSRLLSNDFFDDIFKGDESATTSPKNSPTHLHSPPAKQIKAKGEFPINTPSRFSNEAIRRNDGHSMDQDRTVNDLYSNTFSSSRSFAQTKHQTFKLSSDAKDNSEKLERESEKGDALENQFHFSIYKWAGNGVPMLMPILNNGNDLKLRNKDRNLKGITRKAKAAEDLGEAQQVFVSEKTAEEEPFLETKESTSSEAKLLKEWLHVIEEQQPGLMRKSREVQTRKPKSLSTGQKGQCVKETDSVNDTAGAKGKVREFVEILNQETHSRDKADVIRRSQNYRRKEAYPRKNKSENFINEKQRPTVREEVNLNDAAVHRADHSSKDAYKEEEKHSDSTMKAAAFPSEILQENNSKVSPEYDDDDLNDLTFVVEVLPCDPENVAPAENLEDTKTIDAKIQQWSAGKKGNIQALLSTLQFVLWPGAGWKSIPLVDLLESNSVKRAYQKALLQLHPDKLQQKNASFHQKYIAEKVFGILQEAWDHFNTLAPL